MSVRIGCYSLHEQIGSGSYSHVYSATKSGSSDVFAVKVIPKSLLSSEADYIHFQREIDVISLLNHECIVRLHDFLEIDDFFYVVMDYCREGDLLTYLKQNGRMEEPIAALIFKQIVHAVRYCHLAGIVHRDLKLENILIDHFPAIKLTDFGLCSYIQRDVLMTTFCGSMGYCAPEVITGDRYDGKLTDIWSLGVILYCLVAGEFPWPMTNEAEMIHAITTVNFQMPDDVSSRCKRLLSSLLTKNPKERISLDGILAHPWMEYINYTIVELPISLCKEETQLPPIIINRRINPTLGHLGIVSPYDTTKRSAQELNHENIKPMRRRSMASKMRTDFRRKVCQGTRSDLLLKVNKPHRKDLSFA